jgi:hypothetical protein
VRLPNYFDGYMVEVNFIDGTALDPTSFGETKSGIWVPKAYDGAMARMASTCRLLTARRLAMT